MGLLFQYQASNQKWQVGENIKSRIKESLNVAGDAKTKLHNLDTCPFLVHNLDQFITHFQRYN